MHFIEHAWHMMLKLDMRLQPSIFDHLGASGKGTQCVGSRNSSVQNPASGCHAQKLTKGGRSPQKVKSCENAIKRVPSLGAVSIGCQVMDAASRP